MSNSMPAAPLAFRPPLAPEDRVRANFYAILARLLIDAPDGALLRAVGAAEPLPEEGGSALPRAWNRLVRACEAMDPEAARQEYWDLFVGVGKAAVNLHGSHWIAGFMHEKPLAALRLELARLGVARRPESSLTEDHLGALCETMRLLIEGTDARRPEDLAVQRAFFEGQLAPWVDECCAAMAHSPLANFYARVGEFAIAFLAIERDSLAMA